MASGDNADDQAQGSEKLNDLSKGCQQLRVDENTDVASNAAIKRKKCLRRQKTEHMASCLLNDIKRKILENISDSTEDLSRFDETKILNNDSCNSQTFAKEPLSRKSSVTSSVTSNASTDVDDTHTERIFTQHGDGNLMLIWNTTDSKSNCVWRQVGNKNVMIDMDILSKACQVQDMAGCVIPLDTNGAVWMEIKRRSQVMQNSTENEPTTPNPAQNDCGRDPNPPPPAPPRGPPPTNRNIHNSMEENAWYPGTEFYAECRKPVHRNEPVENYDSSSGTSLGNHDPREPVEHSDPLYEQFNVEEMEDKISVMVKTREGSKRFSSYSNLDENPLINTFLSHPQIVNFISRNESNQVEVSVCELSYEKDQVYSYVNTPAPDDLDDEHYTTVPSSRAPPLPERRYLNEEHHERRNGSPFTENNVNGYPGTSPSQLNGAARQPPLFLNPPSRTNQNRPKPPSPRRRIPAPPGMKSGANNHNNANGGSTESSLVPPSWNGRQPPPSRTRSPTTRPAAPDPQGNSRPWYHGRISGSEANRRLENREDGRFLVRDASNRADNYVRNLSEPEHIYTLQFVDDRSIKRLKIMKNSENWYHFEHTRRHHYQSLEGLIQAILNTGLEIREGERETWKNVSVSPVNINEF